MPIRAFLPKLRATVYGQKSAHHGHYRAGWFLSGGIAAFAKGYEVHGIIRRASTFNTGWLDPIYDDPHSDKARLRLHYGDLSDASALARLVGQIQPEEVYNLAAQSHVRVSFDSPEYTADIVATGTVRLLEAIRADGNQNRAFIRPPPAK